MNPCIWSFFFSSRRRHTRFDCDWSSDVCSSDLRLDVWRLLMEPIAYANGSTLDDPAITFGIVFSNFMSKGVYTFQGGTDKLIMKMKAKIGRASCRERV